MRTSLLAVTAATLLTSPSSFAATADAARVSADHVVVELISESTTLKAGARSWLGLKFTHDPHWHTYWINPGDSGLPTRLDWQLPSGFKALDAEWPAPKRIAYGDLYNFGYEGTTLVPIAVDVPANATGDATLVLNARWLICNDVCIPGKAALTLRVPVSKSESQKNAAVSPLFATSRAARPVAAVAQARVKEAKDRITVELRGANLSSGELDAFPASQKLFLNTPFKVVRNGDTVTFVGERSEYFETAPEIFTLVVTQKSVAPGKPAAWQFDIPWASQNKPAR